jgi:MFS transporter, DHA3 family, tetracycline resistance protein
MNVLKKKDPYQVYIYLAFLSQFFFTIISTVNLLYQVQMVQLSPLQLVLVGSVLEAVVFLFEIPTGLVSDLKSRKLSIIIGYFLIGIGYFLEGLIPTFASVILCQILWGIGYTFTSGSTQAWIADEVGEERASSAFVKGAKAGNFAKVISIPLSMIIGYFMVNLPIIIGGICMIGLAAFLIFAMQEKNFNPNSNGERIPVWKTMKGNLGEIFTFSKTSYVIRILFMIALFFGLYSEGFDRLWISHLLEVTHLKGNIVLLTGGIQFIVVLASFLVLHYVERGAIHQELESIYRFLLLGSLLIIVSLLGYALSQNVFILVIFFILIQVSRTTMYPLEDVWLNKIIPDSSTRATYFSVKGQVDAIGQIGGGPIIGLVAANFTIKLAIIGSAVLLSPVVVLYNLILKKMRE